MTFLKPVIAALCASLLALNAALVTAQTAATYPNKPVRIIVPYSPGGSTTAVALQFSGYFTREMGQNFLLDYRPGGDTAIGTAAAAKAAADGYNLLAATSALITTHYLAPGRSFDALRDFTMVSTLTRSESALLMHPSVPIRSMKEFIAYNKANPGKLNLISNSPLNVLHYQRLMNATGIKFTIVNYKGGGSSLPDLLSGYVDGFLTSTANAHAIVNAGKVRGLAVSGDTRSPTMPGVPTFAEAGVPGYDPNNWSALYAPIKTPRDIIDKLNAQVRRAQSAPDVVSALDKAGLAPFPMGVAQAEDFYRTEVDRFGKLIKSAGLKMEN